MAYGISVDQLDRWKWSHTYQDAVVKVRLWLAVWDLKGLLYLEKLNDVASSIWGSSEESSSTADSDDTKGSYGSVEELSAALSSVFSK